MRSWSASVLAKLYGRFKPDTEERDRWEWIAAGRDREKNGPVVVPLIVPERRRTYMSKAPQPFLRARLCKIAGAGLEPATPAL